MSETYRVHFASASKAAAYDAQQYPPNSHALIAWRVEQEWLSKFLQHFRATHAHIDYLDFATGTGRILAFLQDQVDFATGIEISPAMVTVASTKCRNARLICADITTPQAPVEGRYDLITAFRFALNAEPGLRLAAFKALAARMKDKDSRLVFNNHGHLFSHKLLLWPYHSLRRWGKGYLPEGNYMTHRQAHELCRAAGLEIESIWGSSVLSLRLLRLLSLEHAFQLERRLSSVPLLARLGANQIYVARLA